MSKDAHLYAQPRPAKKQLSTGTTTTNLAFSTALSSLISSSSSASSSTSRPTRPAKRPRGKDDIFTTHNRNTKARALADLRAAAQDDPAAEARWKGKDAPIDDAAWRRARRKMEDKARLYAAMKRGDVEDEGGASDNPRHMVDFDRKWAEAQEAGVEEAEEDDDDDDDDDSDEEVVEFVDEFGRTKRGSRAEAAREQRRQQMSDRLRDEDDRYSARPKQPGNVIFGDTIQTAAFNPDEPVAAQMEELAKKRDREATPPEAVHYDANAEIRSRGTGFFQFSKDEEVRKQQMEDLEKERKETERARADTERDAQKDDRRREIEERRRLIKEKRGKLQADRFLQGLENEMASRDDEES